MPDDARKVATEGSGDDQVDEGSFGEAGPACVPWPHKTLTNSTSVIVLKPTGDAISEAGTRRRSRRTVFTKG